MQGDFELLRMELTEINSYVRHHFQLYLGWYTFFLTVNFGAIGWFTSVLVTGGLKVSLPIVFVAAFFIIQQVFSFVASLQVRSYFLEATSRSREILDQLSRQQSLAFPPACPIPIKVYATVIKLILCTLLSFIFFWIALAVVSLHLVPLH